MKDIEMTFLDHTEEVEGGDFRLPKKLHPQVFEHDGQIATKI